MTKSSIDDIYYKKYKKLKEEFRFIEEMNGKLKWELDVKQADINRQSQHI